MTTDTEKSQGSSLIRMGAGLVLGLAVLAAILLADARTGMLDPLRGFTHKLLGRGHAGGGGDARGSALNSDLQTVRSQIELYKIQHLDALPGTVPGVTLQQHLTMKTDAHGRLDPAGAFGPYLQQFPTNPYSGTNTVNAAGSTNGWNYNPKTGEFDADNVPPEVR